MGLALAGCGFRLRGSVTLAFETLRMTGSTNSPIARELRLALINQGVRVPAVELQFKLMSIPDPVIGEAMSKTWLALDAALRADGGAVLADIFKGLIESPANVPERALLQRQLTASDAAMLGLGLGPAAPGAVLSPSGELPLLQDVDIVPDDSP
jgi:outer membrane lipopolysaccharide assembly protein LptE/RlpB